MVRELIARALQPIKDRLAMVVGRGVLLALSADGGGARAQVNGVADETLDNLEYAQDYGLSSRPHPGAEAVMAFLAGLRSNGMVLRLFDRRYKIALQYGEVAVHDDLGQRVHLTRTGIVATTPLDATIEAAGNTTVKAGKQLLLEGEDVILRGRHSVMRDVGGYAERTTLISEGQLVDEIWHTPAIVTAEPDHTYPAPEEVPPYG